MKAWQRALLVSREEVIPGPEMIGTLHIGFQDSRVTPGFVVARQLLRSSRSAPLRSVTAGPTMADGHVLDDARFHPLA